jgi:hypothetical protein
VRDSRRHSTNDADASLSGYAAGAVGFADRLKAEAAKHSESEAHSADAVAESAEWAAQFARRESRAAPMLAEIREAADHMWSVLRVPRQKINLRETIVVLSEGVPGGGRVYALCRRGRFGWIQPSEYGISGPELALLLPRGERALLTAGPKPGLNRSRHVLSDGSTLSSADALVWFLGSDAPVRYEYRDGDGSRAGSEGLVDPREHFEIWMTAAVVALAEARR